MALRTREYVIQMRGMELARFELKQGCELAIPGATSDGSIEGERAQDPAFGLPAVWIRPDQADRARASGYTVVDPVSIIGTHFSETVKRHSHELFTRQDAKNYCDRVAQDNPKLLEDLVPKLIALSTVQRVLQNLLRERVSIRDAVGILEAVGEAAQTTKNPVLLTEYVRQAIRRAITKPLATPQGELAAFLLDPSMERMVEPSIEHSENNSLAGLAPDVIRDILGKLQRQVDKTEPVVLITNSAVRYFVRQLVEGTFPNLYVLSHNEIATEIRVRSRGVIQ